MSGTREGRVCECGDHAFAPLTKGFVALVSPEDIGVFDRRWSANVHGRHVCAMRWEYDADGKRVVLMHRLIMGANGDLFVDHINSDAIDNRRGNLRFCTPGQNAMNRRTRRDKEPGLSKSVYRNGRRYFATIVVQGKRTYVGSYGTPEEASAAYAEAARRLHGDFARSG